MRKKSSRIPRPVAKPLTTNQQTELMIAPRLHLQMIVGGVVEVDYLMSIIGVLNLANVLAAHQRRDDLDVVFNSAQGVAIRLLKERRCLNATERDVLQEGLNLADAWICSRNTLDLMRATESVDQEFTQPDAA